MCKLKYKVYNLVRFSKIRDKLVKLQNNTNLHMLV